LNVTVQTAQRYRRTDGRTDDIMMPRVYYAACSAIG